MIHFLHTHPSFIEDLYLAANTCSSDGEITQAQTLEKYAGELQHFEATVGWVDPLHEDNVFRLDVGDAKSSWKRWQDNCYTIAKKYDGCLFTYGGIQHLVKRLNEHASSFKNAQPIREPDWKFCWEYGVRPSIAIGDNCVLVFEAVRGYYNIEEGSHE